MAALALRLETADSVRLSAARSRSSSTGLRQSVA